MAGLILGAVAGAVWSTSPAGAQTKAPIGAEWRVDGIVGRTTALEGGFALEVPADLYVRVGVGAATGVAWRDGGTRSASRVDVVARGLFDPFRQAPVGVSLGGGVSLSNAQDGRWRPYVVMVIDIEGKRRGRIVPALQIGLGGGARIGVAIRSATRSWR